MRGGHWGGRCPREGGPFRGSTRSGPCCRLVSAWGEWLHPGHVSSCLWGPCGASLQGPGGACDGRTWGVHKDTRGGPAPFTRQLGCPQHGNVGTLTSHLRGQGGSVWTTCEKRGKEGAHPWPSALLAPWVAASRARSELRSLLLLSPVQSSQRASSLAAPGIPWAASPPKTGCLGPTPRESVLLGLAGAWAPGVLSAAWRTALCSREALRTRGKLSPPGGPGGERTAAGAGGKALRLPEPRDPCRGDGAPPPGPVCGWPGAVSLSAPVEPSEGTLGAGEGGHCPLQGVRAPRRLPQALATRQAAPGCACPWDSPS